MHLHRSSFVQPVLNHDAFVPAHIHSVFMFNSCSASLEDEFEVLYRFVRFSAVALNLHIGRFSSDIPVFKNIVVFMKFERFR